MADRVRHSRALDFPGPRRAAMQIALRLLLGPEQVFCRHKRIA
jgi:hypothetical protein